MVPYPDLFIRNGLAKKIDAELVRYRTTAKRAQALRHMQELEKLMPETGDGGGSSVRYEPKIYS